MEPPKKTYIPDIITPLAEKLGIVPKAGSTRMVIYPYTYSQSFGMFPWRYYYNNVWFARYWFYGILVSYPLFVWIGRQSRSPANYARVAALKARDEEKEREAHEDH